VGNLALVTRKKLVCFWASWPPLGVFWSPPWFRPLFSLETMEARPCSSPPELRSLFSVGLGWMCGYLSDSLVNRSILVGPRHDSLVPSIPCVLGLYPRFTDQVSFLLWGLALFCVSRLWVLGACLRACLRSCLERGCGGPLLPEFSLFGSCTFELDT